MISGRMSLVVGLSMIAHALAFAPNSGCRHAVSARAPRTMATEMPRKTIHSDGQWLSMRAPPTRTTTIGTLHQDESGTTPPRNIVVLSMAKPANTQLNFAEDDHGMTNSSTATGDAVEEDTSLLEMLKKFPSVELVTLELAEHVPLGCTIEESLNEDDNYVFVSKLVSEGNAETSGILLGDVVVGVTGPFGEISSTIGVNVETIQRLVSVVPAGDPLTIQVARGTDVLERHESKLVDLCTIGAARDKEIEAGIEEFWYDGYCDDYEPEDNTFNVDEADGMIDDMMNIWASELPKVDDE